MKLRISENFTFGAFVLLNLAASAVYYGVDYWNTKTTPFFISGYSGEVLMAGRYLLIAFSFALLWVSVKVVGVLRSGFSLGLALVLFFLAVRNLIGQKLYLFGRG